MRQRFTATTTSTIAAAVVVARNVEVVVVVVVVGRRGRHRRPTLHQGLGPFRNLFRLPQLKEAPFILLEFDR